MIKKPNTIYTTEETTTTTKPFNYGKPEGWDKKPPLINPKKFKMKWWEILKSGLLGENMEPKYFMRYEGWMHELKIICFAVLFTFSLGYLLFHSSFITTSAMNDKDNDEPTLFDRGLDYIIGKYDDWRDVTPIIKPDTIHQVVKDTLPAPVPMITQQELDSIINVYNSRIDSIKAVDTTLK